jgi:hypothetical protein
MPYCPFVGIMQIVNISVETHIKKDSSEEKIF